MKYKDELVRTMEFLARDERVIFIGQSIAYSGNAIFNTVKDIAAAKRLEMPVCEDMQMGMSIGLALEGYIPVTCYPRFDFLLLACNQLVNHLDKIECMSRGKMKPRVIIRTSIGAKSPLDGGVQHTQDHTDAFRKMLSYVDVVFLDEPEEIFPAFKHALERDDCRPTLLIEKGDHYNDK